MLNLRPAFFNYLNFNSLAKLNCLLHANHFLAVTFSDRMNKDLESLVCNAAAEAKFYSVQKIIFLFTLTSRI